MNELKELEQKIKVDIVIGSAFILLSILFLSVVIIGMIFINPDLSHYNQGEIFFISFSFTLLVFSMCYSLVMANDYFKTYEGDDEK